MCTACLILRRSNSRSLSESRLRRFYRFRDPRRAFRRVRFDLKYRRIRYKIRPRCHRSRLEPYPRPRVSGIARPVGYVFCNP